MAKKSFGMLKGALSAQKTTGIIENKEYISDYDYTGIAVNDEDNLLIAEQEVKRGQEAVAQGYFTMAEHLYKANEILANYDNTEGKFLAWCDNLNLKKTRVYNLLKRYELYLLSNNQELVEHLPQKHIEIIGAKKIDRDLKLELLNDEKIATIPTSKIKKYVEGIISDRSEMIGTEKAALNTNIEEAEIINCSALPNTETNESLKNEKMSQIGSLVLKIAAATVDETTYLKSFSDEELEEFKNHLSRMNEMLDRYKDVN